VRKIIRILLALSVVLGLMVTATPVAAKVITPVATLSSYCACTGSTYNITFNISASLTQGVHSVCIKFPAGTTFKPTGGAWGTGSILIGMNGTAGTGVFPAEITVTGTEVCFLVPVTYEIGANPILVQFTAKAGVINPCTPGKYQLEVKTSRAPDSTYVLSNKYTIVPCMSSYVFAWDSNPSYPGIAAGFVPPFKACGQNGTQVENEVAHPTIAGAWMNAFNVTFKASPAGCYAPCTTVDIYAVLTASPQFPCTSGAQSKVTLNLTHPTNSSWTLNTTTLIWDPCTDADGVPTEILIADDVPLTAAFTTTWAGLIHFDTVGDYTLCFRAYCPGASGAPCGAAATGESLLVEKCFNIKVYQWKDVGKIILDEKWNLISLPLVPFDTSIAGLLASLSPLALDADGAADLVSIWNYSGGTWSNYPGALTTMVDGKSYWVRMSYPMAGSYTWYVFGTARNMPPAAPSAYSVVPGWNMFGFTSLTTKDIGGALPAYLWNFTGTTNQPLVYGWDNTGDWLTSGWSIKLFNLAPLVSGQGYWGAFPAAGTIIP